MLKLNVDNTEYQNVRDMMKWVVDNVLLFMKK